MSKSGRILAVGLKSLLTSLNSGSADCGKLSGGASGLGLVSWWPTLAMEHGKHKKVELPPEALQEFLEAITEPEERLSKRQWKALTSYAELQYKMRGGGRCSICNSPVRHVLPVIAEHENGSTAQYECLCTRCLEGEKGLSKKLTIKVGETTLEYTPEHRKAPKTQKFRAYSG